MLTTFHKNHVRFFLQGDLHLCFENLDYTRTFISKPIELSDIPIKKIAIDAGSLIVHFEEPTAITHDVARVLLAFYYIFQKPTALIDGWEFVLDGSPPENDSVDMFAINDLTIHNNILKGHNGEALSYVVNWPVYKQENQSALQHASLGKISIGYNERLAPFDETDFVPHLPNGDFLCISHIDEVDADKGFCKTRYDVKDQSKPIVTLLEAALQPCGWLNFHMMLFSSFDEKLFFRNLNGDLTFLCDMYELPQQITFEVYFLNKARLGQNILLNFDIKIFDGAKELAMLKTTFGCFSKKGLQDQKGLKGPDLFDPARYAPIPFDQGLVDDILYCDMQEIWARRIITPDDWYFKNHFMHDPVQPGSIGLQILVDLAGLYVKRYHNVKSFAFAQGSKLKWRYRGQVLPTHKVLDAKLEVIEIKDGKLLAQGFIFVDQKCIYHLEEFCLVWNIS